MGLLAQQTQEGHLDHTHRFVRHLGSSTHVRVPVLLAALLAPRNVGHLRRLQVRVDASFSRASHVTKDVDGVVRHAQVGVNPVPTCPVILFHLAQVFLCVVLSALLTLSAFHRTCWKKKMGRRIDRQTVMFGSNSKVKCHAFFLLFYIPSLNCGWPKYKSLHDRTGFSLEPCGFLMRSKSCRIV